MKYLGVTDVFEQKELMYTYFHWVVSTFSVVCDTKVHGNNSIRVPVDAKAITGTVDVKEVPI